MPEWVFPDCPQPPDWTLDWEPLTQRFDWLRALEGTPQEPEYHAEGDVLTHTRMVAEALIAGAGWRALSLERRTALFAAALLHDVAKPACTRIAPDGGVSSPGHARAGAPMAREILTHGEGFALAAPFPQREAIARLVRLHGLPLWFLEKRDSQRAVLAASMSARLDDVAALAEADVRGRICADEQGLLERVALFRAYCEEQACLTQPYAFASDHSRFVYFRDPTKTPTYAAYDDTVCEVTLMSGLPGAGKDTWIARHAPELPVISLDAIRRELKVTPADDQGAVAALAKSRTRELLRRQQSIIWNATNITHRLRAALINLFAAYHARVRIVYVDAPWDVILRRNQEREASVPEPVIARMLRKLEVPDLTEAHSVEWVWSDETSRRITGV
jgi:putative nucleotidyltransferase with HDIG domain